MRRLAAALLGISCACTPAGDEHATRVRQALGGEPPVTLYVVLEGEPAAAMHPSPDRSRRRIEELGRLRAALRPELEARGAAVLGELSRLANAFVVRVPPARVREIAALAGVARVEPVPVHHRALATAVPLVGAPELWAAGVPIQGDGIRIGIVDTGIDYTHAHLGGSGDPADYQNNDRTILEAGTFPTARVVGGWDFAGDGYDASDPALDTPAPDADPLDCDGHGTHVAGIAAGGGVLAAGLPFSGPYEQSLDPADFAIHPGMAPRAELYALKVFGCDGSTQLTALAFERAADPDEDGDFSDRLDVVNASLGAAYGLQNAVNAEIVENLTAVGTSLVVAAGNDGNNFFVTATPGNYPQALSVAASTDASFVTLRVDAPDALAGDYAAAEGSFTAPLADGAPISGPLVAADPFDACTPLDNASSVAGAIAFVARGGCAFIDKFQVALAAGAVAVVVMQDELDDGPFTMGGSVPSPLPGVMIGHEDGEALAAARGVSVTLLTDRFVGPGSELLAGFTSRGPSSVDALMKPELSAPGSSIQSARVGTGIGVRTSGGTSMASPMVAGAAALVRQAHPELSPHEVKALLVDTAMPIGPASGTLYPLSLQGAGRLDVAAAVAREVTASADASDGSVGVSFGAVVAGEPTSVERSVTVKSHGSTAVQYATAVEPFHPLPGVTLSVSPESFTLPAGGSQSLTLALTLDPEALGAPPPDPFTSPTQNDLPRHHLHEAAGRLALVDAQGAQSIAVPFHASVRAAARRRAGALHACPADEAGERLLLSIEGAAAHPEPAVSAFELGGIDEDASEPSLPAFDLRAFGVASDALHKGMSEASLHFAVAVAGQWTTPAQGPYFVVAVELDVDENRDADSRVVPEPFRREEPFADVLVSSVYDLSTGERVGGKRYLNMASRAELDTQPFHNGVLVLSAFARDVGLDEEDSGFRYRALSVAPAIQLDGDATDWISFDALAPRIDTSRSSGPPRPLFAKDDGPIELRIDRREPAELLLLHHTNVAEERYEVVPLDAFETESARLEAESPPAIAPGARAVLEVFVENDGDEPLREARLEGSVEGAPLEIAAPSQGACEKGALACALGTIAPQERVRVGLHLGASIRGGASVALSLSSASGCVHERSLEVPASAAAPVAALTPDGGCGCRAAGGGAPGRWMLAALLLLLLRRRPSTTKR